MQVTSTESKMYKSIKKTVSYTTNGTYKQKDWHFDFERLPWVQWLDIGECIKGFAQLDW